MTPFLAGARAAIPVVLGYLGIGFAAGAVERAAGLSYAEIALLSMVLYAGSAQFVVTSMLSLSAAAPAIVFTVFLLNARHLLLSAALAPKLAGVPMWKNALVGLQLTDETFVVATAQHRLSPAWMAGLNLAAWSAWAVANLAGAALSSLAPDTRALAFALPCMFAGLLVLQARAAPQLGTACTVALLAAAIAVLLHAAAAGPAAILLATALGATGGLLIDRWKSARR